MFVGVMTAQERVDEWIEVGEGEARQQPEPQQGQVQGQNEEKQEEPQTVIVDSTITVDTVVEQNGKVEGTFHEEVDVQQSFTLEEPQPYGPDESLQDGKGDEEECGFCLFMKAGPCGKRFAAWEACVDDAETAGTNIVEKCAQMTHYLKDCMEDNPEYYGPVLQAEKAMDEQASREASKSDTDTEKDPNNLESIPA